MAKKGKLGLSMDDFVIETTQKEPDAAVAPAEPTVTPESEVSDPEKRKQGRPKTKTEAEHRLGVGIPLSLWEKVEVAKKCYGDNARLYIVKLIERDLADHYEEYVKRQDNLFN